jgi:hypothetical protein
MTLARTWTALCDRCREATLTLPGANPFEHLPDIARRLQRDHGWKIARVGPGWEHCCPDCAESGEPGRRQPGAKPATKSGKLL